METMETTEIKSEDNMITIAKELANKMFDENSKKQPELYKDIYREFYCLIYMTAYCKGYTDSAIKILSEVREMVHNTK